MYSDGAWEPAKDDDKESPPAGWGVAEFECTQARERGATANTVAMAQRTRITGTGVNGPQYYGTLTWATGGTVAIEPSDSAEYVGATKHTNNTGELTAMHAMIDRALATPPGRQRVVMHSDSLYAINMAQGTWMPAKRQNHEIIRSLRRK